MEIKRDNKEMKVVKEILKQLNDDEDTKFEDKIEGMPRMGRYEAGRARPIKLKLRSQLAT